MPELFLKFAISLEDYSDSGLDRNFGPNFHRWLPNGESDSILLDIGHPNLELRIWHERRGYTDSNEIKFDFKKNEVDPTVMSKQGVLHAGPLFGCLVYRNPPIQDIDLIQGSSEGNPEYFDIAKFLVVDIIYPAISRLINVYRINFGQYWVPSLKHWDSQIHSLGTYCKHMNMTWSLDTGKNWKPFIPNAPKSTLSFNVNFGGNFREFITIQDWHNMSKLAMERSDLSTAELLLNRSHRFLDEGNIRPALIEAVTTLELAIMEYVHRNSLFCGNTSKTLDAFWSLPLKTRMVALAIPMNEHSGADIEQALEAIELRNKAVHEGHDPPENAYRNVKSLLFVITSFLPAPEYRFPSNNPGNAYMENDGWNKIYAKYEIDPIDEMS